MKGFNGTGSCITETVCDDAKYFFGKNIRCIASKRKGENIIYTVEGLGVANWHPGTLLLNPGESIGKIVQSVSGKTALVKTCIDYGKRSVYGITAFNPEQKFALDFLMNPDIYLVILTGKWGTGKTLLAMAAALQQVFNREYNGIIFTREPIPIGRDLGFSKGDDDEKMFSWLGALKDNWDFLDKNGYGQKSKQLSGSLFSIIDMLPLCKMAGSSPSQKFLILDEAQNITKAQMELFISRAGPGTKVVIMGNLKRIDNSSDAQYKHITEKNSGLTRAIEVFGKYKHAGHVALQQVVRSPIVEYLNEYW